MSDNNKRSEVVQRSNVAFEYMRELDEFRELLLWWYDG